MTQPAVQLDAEQPDQVDRRRWVPRGDLAALGLYLLTRLVELGLITWLAGDDPVSLKSRLLKWDGGWFVDVATKGYPHGYSYDADGVMVGNGLAFFPGYPMLIRGLHALGPDAGTAAIAISYVAGAVAAVLLRRLGTALADRRVGYALVVLFCAQPMSVVLGLGYSEGLFSALVIGMLLATHRRHWLTAGGLGLAAALTRPTGLAAAIALTVAAGLALRERTAGWRAGVAAAVALLGGPGYLLWVAYRVGDLNAWFTIQTAGWGTTTDFGRSTVDFIYDSFRYGAGWVQISVALLLIVAGVAAVLAVVRKVWLPLTVYGLLALGLVLGQAGYYHSKPRLMVPVLLILLPAAYAAGRARPRTAALALAGYALFGLWYGAYMITIWPYTI